jgi:hypothetical protein
VGWKGKWRWKGRMKGMGKEEEGEQKEILQLFTKRGE